jgi:hypothetical protein
MPGGIFSSQVVDVCVFLKEQLNYEVTLVSFVSLRGFSTVKQKICAQFPDAIVLPMFPGVGRWAKNGWLLRKQLRKINPQTIIARGPFAAALALRNSSATVCFDARGAYAAEFSEYDVSGGKIKLDEIKAIESEAIKSSPRLLAVSSALVRYWKSEYAYNESKHVIIPCTMSHVNTEATSQPENRDTVRIVFAGGNGKWQSLDMMSQLLIPAFEKDSRLELIMLTRADQNSIELKRRFADRVKIMWLPESEVHSVLSSCDYGWLVREDSVTNKVASPVKFAEYLSAGLSVIVSRELGDFSSFIREHGCGLIAGETELLSLHQQTTEERTRNIQLAMNYFSKEKYREEYRRCVE